MTGRAKMIAVSGALPEKRRRWGNWVADGQGTWGCPHLHVMTEAGQQWGLRLAGCQNTGTWPLCVVSQPGRVWASSEHGTWVLRESIPREKNGNAWNLYDLASKCT